MYMAYIPSVLAQIPTYSSHLLNVHWINKLIILLSKSTIVFKLYKNMKLGTVIETGSVTENF